MTQRIENDHDHDHSNANSRCLEPEPSRYLAIDTNVLISHLRMVRALHAAACASDRLNGIEESTLNQTPAQVGALLIPSIVINELDKLSLSTKLVLPESSGQDPSLNRGETVGMAAKRATAWLLSITRAQRKRQQDPSSTSHQSPSRLRCQTWTEKIDRTLTKPDDRILDCCLFFAQSGQGKIVTLWTDDSNLCLLAESNRIPTISTQRGTSAAAFESDLGIALGLSKFTFPPPPPPLPPPLIATNPDFLHQERHTQRVDINLDEDIDIDMDLDVWDDDEMFKGREEDEDMMELDKDLSFDTGCTKERHDIETRQVNSCSRMDSTNTIELTTPTSTTPISVSKPLTTTSFSIPTTTLNFLYTLLLSVPLPPLPTTPSLFSILLKLQSLPTPSTSPCSPTLFRAQARVASSARTILLFLQSRHVDNELIGRGGRGGRGEIEVEKGARRIRSGEAADAWKVLGQSLKVLGWQVGPEWESGEEHIRNLI